MRIVIEVEGAEISITAKEAAAKGASEESLLAQVAVGEGLDAGAAPSPGTLSGPETVASQQVMTTLIETAGADAGAAPSIFAADITPGPATPVVSTPGDGEAIDAGAAKFIPPVAETMEGA